MPEKKVASPHAAVFRGKLFVCFNFSDKKGAKFFKAGSNLVWSEVTVPAEIAHCYGMASCEAYLCIYFMSNYGSLHVASSTSGASESWVISTEGSPLQQFHAGMAIVDGCVNLLGGQERDVGTPLLSDCACYNLCQEASGDPWSHTHMLSVPRGSAQLPALPQARSCHQILRIDNDLYVLGGYQSTEFTSDFHLASNTSDSLEWQISPLPKSLKNCAATSFAGFAWVAGGCTPWETFMVKETFCFDPSMKQAIPLPDLVSPRYRAALVVFNDQLMLIGGADSEQYHCTIQALDLRRTEHHA